MTLSHTKIKVDLKQRVKTRLCFFLVGPRQTYLLQVLTIHSLDVPPP